VEQVWYGQMLLFNTDKCCLIVATDVTHYFRQMLPDNVPYRTQQMSPISPDKCPPPAPTNVTYLPRQMFPSGADKCCLRQLTNVTDHAVKSSEKKLDRRSIPQQDAAPKDPEEHTLTDSFL